jgi:hypothetical protein
MFTSSGSWSSPGYRNERTCSCCFSGAGARDTSEEEEDEEEEEEEDAGGFQDVESEFPVAP